MRYNTGMSAEPPKPRAQRQQFDSRVRFVVSDHQEIKERFAANLSEGGMFVRDDAPPAVGSLILIEFVLPDGGPLCRAAARVVHSRPATAPGDKTAGMGLQFVKLDQVAQEIARQLDRERAPTATSSDISEKRLLNLDGMERPILTASGPVVGIDLGTVNSCVAVVEHGSPRVVLSPEGYDVLPSVVFVASEGKLFVGHKALARMILEPHRAIYGAKRFLGRPFVSREVQTYGHFFNYELVPGNDGRTAAKVGEDTVDLEEVSGQILLKLREMAEQHLGQSVARAVVTVPAYFGETQRQAVREAARRAGLTVERILNEPTAAAVAYGYGRSMSKTILVYDLGGGTFDATLLRIRDNTFEVLATDGDPFLGGADFDDRLTEYVLSSFERERKLSLRGDAVAVQRIRFAVELAKRQLSELTTTDIDLTYITQSERGAVHLHMTLERELFERLTQDLVDRTLALVQVVLDRAGITNDTLDDVLAVGGQSRSPHVQRALYERFQRRPSNRVHPTEVVALGAAIIADTLHSDRRVQLADILPGTIRVGHADGSTRVLFARGVRLPVETEFEVPPSEGAQIRIRLYRGDAERVDGNTFLAAIVFPPVASSAALSARAKVKVRISGDGLMSVVARHPVTGEVRELGVSLSGS